MTCKEDVRLSLFNQITADLASGKTAEQLNDSYGYTVVDDKGDITIPQELIDKYWEQNKPTALNVDRIQEVHDSIKNIQVKSGIRKVGDKEGYVDEKNNPVKRITDVVKEFYATKFSGNKEFTPEEQAENDVKAERGTQFHKDMENMFRMFIDPLTGKKRYTTQEEKDAIDLSGFEPTADVIDSFKDEYTSIIAGYVKDKLDTYSDDARFLFETVVYNKKDNLAGTVDFIAIDHKGVDILDWKSIYKLSDDGRIYPTKKQGFNIQLNEYFNAIKFSADLSNDEFNEIRVIPVLPKLNSDKDITSLSMGKVRPKNDPIGLLPVLSEKDAAYKGTVKNFLASTNKILARENDRESRERGFKNAQDWELKRELEEALTQVIIQQNPEQLFEFIDDILARTTKYLEDIDNFNKDTKFTSQEDRDKIAEKLRDASTAINGLGNFIKFSQDNLSEYTKDADNKSKVSNYIVEIAEKREQVINSNRNFLDKVARSVGITGITKPQVEIGFLKKWTTFFRSNPATKAVETFSKLFGDNSNRTVLEQESAKYKFLNIKEELSKWAQKNNQKLNDVYESFINKDKFSLKGKIDFVKFREARAEAFGEKETREKFLADNYDLEAYNKALEEFLKEKYAEIDARSFSDIESKDNEIKTIKKNNLKKKYTVETSGLQQIEDNKFLHSLNKDTGKYSFFKEDKWHSDFFKEISKVPEKLAFYNHIISVNKRAKDTGLVSDQLSMNFIPHIFKGMLETGWDFKAQRDRYLRNIGTDPDNYQFGNIDPISGLPVEKMFIPYTFDLSKKVDGKKDFTELSTDLSRLFGAFEQEIISAENKQNLESLFILLRDLEESNKVINVNKFGKPLLEKGTTNELSTSEKGRNSENYKYIDKFGRLLIYGQSIQDLKDKLIKTPLKDKEGKSIYISAIRVLQELAGLSRATAFGGLNIVAPLRNFVMGRLSTIVQESPYFNSTLSFKNYVGFLEEFKFNVTDKHHQKIAASLAYFLPNLLQTGQYLNKLDMFAAGFHTLSPENMFKLIQKSEEFVRIPIHLALMDNSTVRDGAIVNINQLVRKEFKDKLNVKNLNEYLHMLPRAEATELNRQIKQRTSQLLKEDNLFKYMEISPEGTMSIKGVDRNDPSVYQIRNITENLSSKATGSVTKDNASLLATNYMFRMFAMFRNWIPLTVSARFGDFHKNNLDDTYDEGRMVSLFNYVWNNHQSKLKGFTSLLGGFVGIHDKKNVIESIKDIYNKKTTNLVAINKIDRPSEISEEEFTQLYFNNIQAAYNDLRATSLLLLLVATSVLASGEGGDDGDKNKIRALKRELAKYSQEFTFYYNPRSAFDIIKSPFPIVNYHSNVSKIFTQTIKAAFALATDNDEMYDNANPTKYLLKSIPLTSFFVPFLPIIDEDLAKQWNVKINPNYSF